MHDGIVTIIIGSCCSSVAHRNRHLNGDHRLEYNRNAGDKQQIPTERLIGLASHPAAGQCFTNTRLNRRALLAIPRHPSYSAQQKSPWPPFITAVVCGVLHNGLDRHVFIRSLYGQKTFVTYAFCLDGGSSDRTAGGNRSHLHNKSVPKTSGTRQGKPSQTKRFM